MFSWAGGLGVALGFALGLYFHDFAHHAVAVARGDKTPRLMGRYPPRLKSMADPLGTYVLPGVFVVTAAFGHLLTPFGWTKPHALGLRGFRGGRVDVILSSLAGPAATALLAFLAGLLVPTTSLHSYSLVYGFVWVNASLTIFELLPIPGRDGGRILQQFLSPSAAMKMEELGQHHILFLLVLFIFLQGVAASMIQVSCSALAPSVCG